MLNGAYRLWLIIYFLINIMVLFHDCYIEDAIYICMLFWMIKKLEQKQRKILASLVVEATFGVGGWVFE